VSARVRGGVFGLVDASAPIVKTPAPGSFAAALAGRGACIATSHARGGLELLVERLDPTTVWLPAYLCDALLTPRVRERARFFGVGERLELDEGRIGALPIEKDDLFVAIAYFGRAPEVPALDVARSAGARIVLDASGALLTAGLERSADYLLASPRKFVGVPDGGLLVPVGDAPWFEGDVDLAPWPAAARAREAGAARAAFDARGGDGEERDWYAAFVEAERAAPDEPRAVDAATPDRLRRVDWAAVARRRRDNHAVLARAFERANDLRAQLLHPDLGADAVPLGAFCVFDGEEARDAARAALYAASIYAPLHWSLDGVVPRSFEAEHDLAARSLTLVCDQRYDERDMIETVETMRVAARGEVSS